MLSGGAQAAIEVEYAIVCIPVFCEKHGRIGDLVRLSKASRRNLLDQLLVPYFYKEVAMYS